MGDPQLAVGLRFGDAQAPLLKRLLKRLGQPGEAVLEEIVIAPDLPMCLADPRLLRIVFQNLLANALKFTRGCPERRIEIDWEAGTAGEVRYRVRDNGVGFDPSQAERIFGMFQRLHSADDFEGTGLGLAIVERVVHRHGGRVTAEATVGGGATFAFSLGAEDARHRRRLVVSTDAGPPAHA
ncbi:unannotated protein [freshwater metagenome]|uniref:histidine kinase n=1 Tax=freshwater metagenome TaxID=449393 RepID=A0A6J7H104_9ZZZZ